MLAQRTLISVNPEPVYVADRALPYGVIVHLHSTHTIDVTATFYVDGDGGAIDIYARQWQGVLKGGVTQPIVLRGQFLVGATFGAQCSVADKLNVLLLEGSPT